MAKPMVLLIRQYSVGKTTFICYLLERDFPGARIGAEQTTEKFVALMYGTNERVVPGNAAVQKDKPFKALETFGMPFVNRFEVSEVSSPILEHMTLIDSPGYQVVKHNVFNVDVIFQVLYHIAQHVRIVYYGM